MNLTIFTGILMGMLLFSLYLGKKAARETKSKEDFFLMGRNLPFLGLTFTILATQLGGGTILGAADEAYQKGWFVFFYPLGMGIGLFLLGLGFGARMRSSNLTTISEVFEKIYNAKLLRQIAAFLSILSLYFILVGQGIAIRKFFIAMGFETPFLFILLWCVLVFYTSFGGLKAVVKTDILQASFILFSFFLILISLLLKPPVIGQIPNLSFTNENFPWTGWLMMPLLFMLIAQDMGQRCFAAKTPKTVSLAATVAALVFLIASIIPIYLGRLAKICDIFIPEGASVLLCCSSAFFGPIVSSFLMAAILMAILSTADSLLCSISSNLCLDFSWIKSKNTLGLSRTLTFFVGISALIFSFTFDSVVMMLIFSYELSVCVLAVPVLLAFLRQKGEKSAAIGSMLCGAIGFSFFRFLPTYLPKELLCLLFSLFGFYGSLLLKKRGIRPLIKFGNFTKKM